MKFYHYLLQAVPLGVLYFRGSNEGFHTLEIHVYLKMFACSGYCDSRERRESRCISVLRMTDRPYTIT